jgi:hypothetical protein
VLIYEDKMEQEFVAHALEFDLVGAGATFDEAKSNLADCIRAQLQFCVENDMLGSIWRPAPKDVFGKWERAQKSAFTARKTERRPRADMFRLPELLATV